jgi:hypothetical protein
VHVPVASHSVAGGSHRAIAFTRRRSSAEPRRDECVRGIAVTPSREAGIAFTRQKSGRWRVRDRSACSLPVSTASSRDYVLVAIAAFARRRPKRKSDHGPDAWFPRNSGLSPMLATCPCSDECRPRPRRAGSCWWSTRIAAALPAWPLPIRRQTRRSVRVISYEQGRHGTDLRLRAMTRNWSTSVSVRAGASGASEDTPNLPRDRRPW